VLIVDLVIWGLLIAFVLSKLFARTREPIGLDLLFLGAGLLIGAGIYFAFGAVGLNLYTILAASTAAILLIAGFRAVPDHLPAKNPGWRNMFAGGTLTTRWNRWRSVRTPDPESIANWEGEGGAPVPPAIASRHKA